MPAAAGWRRDPFRLAREDERLYGLGTSDMKGTIAAVLLALRAAEACGIELAYDPMLLFCTDEEGGLYPGVRYLAEQGMLEGHVLNFNGSAAPRIWAGCFGLFNLLIRLRGETVHAGDGNRAGRGVNAIEQALPVLGALQALKPLVARRQSALPPPPHASGPLAAQLSIVSAHGGTSGGQIPALFEIVVNRRYPPEEALRGGAGRDRGGGARRRARPRPASRWRPISSAISLPTDDPTGPHWPRWQRALSARFRLAARSRSANGARRAARISAGSSAPACAKCCWAAWAGPSATATAPTNTRPSATSWRWRRSVLAYLAADFAARSQSRPSIPAITEPRMTAPPPPPASSPPPAVSPSALSDLLRPSPDAAPKRGGTLRISVDQAVAKLNPLADAGQSGVPRRRAAVFGSDAPQGRYERPSRIWPRSWTSSLRLHRVDLRAAQGRRVPRRHARARRPTWSPPSTAILDPKTASPARQYIGPIAKVSAKDDSTVVFTLSSPFADLPVTLAYTSAKIVPAAVIKARAGDASTARRWAPARSSSSPSSPSA